MILYLSINHRHVLPDYATTRWEPASKVNPWRVSKEVKYGKVVICSGRSDRTILLRLRLEDTLLDTFECWVHAPPMYETRAQTHQAQPSTLSMQNKLPPHRWKALGLTRVTVAVITFFSLSNMLQFKLEGCTCTVFRWLHSLEDTF